MKSRIFATIALLSFLLLALLALSGCAALQKQLDAQQPADKGNLAAQISQAIHDATTRPSIEAAAASFPWGETVLGAIGGLASIAAYFSRQQATKAQGQLAVVQSATGTDNAHDAVAAAVAATGAVPTGTNAGTPAATAPKT